MFDFRCTRIDLLFMECIKLQLDMRYTHLLIFIILNMLGNIHGVPYSQGLMKQSIINSVSKFQVLIVAAMIVEQIRFDSSLFLFYQSRQKIKFIF